MTLSQGTRLGTYEIVAPLGAGGMGEVYRALDPRLERNVAIKVLPERLANDADALARFEREAKAVAALSHPNILAIHDVGHEHGISFVVTELLEGETLRDRMQRSEISWRQAVEITVAVADGLAAAHAKGVIHRDLKPENLFITTAGHMKILDFGLARMEPEGHPGHAAESTPTMTLNTRPGAILGTLNYMSPEQVRGLRTDGRSDIFSLGCVVYEMIAGHRAFTGDTAADTMTAILMKEPAGIRDARTGIRPELERVIVRCLEKKPEQRFQSAPDLAFTLRSLLADTSVFVPPRRALPWYAKTGIAALVAAALLVSAFIVRREPGSVRREAGETIDSLAVLPLENVSRDPEQEYFVDGMTEALISELAKIGGLKVISRTSVMRYKATTKSLPEIAKELDVDAVVEGSVLRVGERVRITAQLIHAVTEENLWADSYDRDLRDVLTLHSELARTIAQEIKVTLTPQEQARMVEARPVNPAAHEAYLKGRFYWDKRTPDGLQKAVEYFEQAVTLDPDWPLAHAGLADAYVLMPQYSSMRPSEAIPKARAAAAKALEMDESLAEAHASMAFIATLYDWNWPLAEREYERAIVLSPNYATAHQWYATRLLVMGRHDEALREITKAQELDPLSLIIGAAAGRVHYCAGDLEQAETQLRKTLELGPDFAVAHARLAKVLYLQQKSADALSEARVAVRLSNNPYCAAILSHVYAKSGQPEEARRILDELADRSKEAYVAPSWFAVVHAGLDERDRMFDWLDRAYQERDLHLLYTLPDPLLADMRSDRRFVELVRRVGLPPLAPIRASDPPLSPITKGGNRGVTDDKVMLAVLPFENLSRDPEQDYFSDGLTEEMISRLSQLNPKKLGVIARTSAMHYKNTAKTIDAIGRELDVAYIVEGSVRRDGQRVRITAQLIAVSDQTHLWAENYERDLKDIFALQSDVAQRVAGSLTVELLPGTAAASARARPVNPEAYQAYLKGRFHWNKRTPDAVKKATEYLEEAVRLAPDWPLAYAGLADSYLGSSRWASMPPGEATAKARAAATKALELDQFSGEAHVCLAWIATTYAWDWPAAEREYKRALELSPNYAFGHQQFALHLLFMGRYDEALQEANQGYELDPLSVAASIIVGVAHIYAGDFQRAESQFRKVLDLDTHSTLARMSLARALVYQARLEEAVVEAREAVLHSDNSPRFIAQFGYILGKAGRNEEAWKILDQLVANAAREYVAPTHFALVHVGLDEKDRAFEWLEKAYEERDVWLTQTLTEPYLAPMRPDPRFADLVRRVGLPPLAPQPESIPSRARE